MNILLKIYVWIVSAFLAYMSFSAFLRDVGTGKLSYIVILLMCSFIVSCICLFISPFLPTNREIVKYILFLLLFPGALILLLLSIKEAIIVYRWRNNISIQAVYICMGLIAYIVQYYYIAKIPRAT
jgi:hypothetical protein